MSINHGNDEKNSDTKFANYIDKEKINAFAKRAIDVQYESETSELNNLFSKEFIEKIEPSFFKSELKPYSILSIGEPIFDEKNSFKSFYINVRLKDLNAEYIQEIHFIEISGLYLISNIENGI